MEVTTFKPSLYKCSQHEKGPELMVKLISVLCFEYHRGLTEVRPSRLKNIFFPFADQGGFPSQNIEKFYRCFVVPTEN